ncbi:putative RNA-directed DNA polymerase [Helianthus annuus]|nr:putative RNA-directed DNA polymerase [Helianthus annuus]
MYRDKTVNLWILYLPRRQSSILECKETTNSFPLKLRVRVSCHAMSNTAAKIVWLTQLLRELYALPPYRPTLLCDNKSALFLSQNVMSHKRVKHIDIDYHFIMELVSVGKLHTKFVPTTL